MLQENLNKQIFITAVLLIVVICLFQFTNLDIFVQSHFYNYELKSWFIDKNEPILKFLLYDGLKKAIIIFNVLILIALLFFRKKQLIQEYKKGLIIVLLSSIIIPSFIGTLKAITNTPCPCNLVEFGGEYPEKKLFDSYPENFVQKSKVKCWPAGHASGGFALMSLFFLFKTPKNRKIALAIVLVLAWSMGNYKMLLGDHFLSHTIITMLLSWLIISIIVKFTTYLQRRNIEKSTKI